MELGGKDPVLEMIGSSDVIFDGFDASTSVLVKISLNSPNPYPATTSNRLLDAVLDCLRQRGVERIRIGDSSGLVHIPSRKTVKKKGLDRLKKNGYRVFVFDYGGWVDIPVNGTYFKNIILSDSIYKYDRIINISNVKSHWMAAFTFSTKALVGLMHPGRRWELHQDHLQKRIAELSLAVNPDINIIDGRKVFVDRGPDDGKVAGAGKIFVNSDLMEADLKAYDLLFRAKEKNGIHDLDEDPYNNDFFRHFKKLREQGQ
jgi:uncharacterized protein (DUF362 family)